MVFDPNQRSARTVADRYQVDLMLDRTFGLTRLPFEQAVRHGDSERRKTNADDAPGAGGYYAWTRTLRALRRETRKDAGWHRDAFRNIPATFSNDKSKVIAVSSGDECTGRNGPDPSTKNIKGCDAEVAIDGNRLRYDEFDPFDDGPVDFFYLLYYMTDDGMWAEVSQPTFRDTTGHITGWGVRLLLGEILPHGGHATRRPAAPVSPVQPIDVSVERKIS